MSEFETVVIPCFRREYQLAKGLKTTKIADLVVSAIRSAMIDGSLKEGDRLPREPELIELFGVSRGVVRESLKLLESQRLITIQRGAHGGAVVCQDPELAVGESTLVTLQLQKATLGDYYQASCVIVPRAARLAAEHRPQEAGLVLMEQVALQQELWQRGDEDRVSRVNAVYNSHILQQCGNKTLVIMDVPLRQAVGRIIGEIHQLFKREAGVAYTDFIARALEANQQVAGLIEAGKASAAERFWEDYMKSSGDYFFSKVSPERTLAP